MCTALPVKHWNFRLKTTNCQRYHALLLFFFFFLQNNKNGLVRFKSIWRRQSKCDIHDGIRPWYGKRHCGKRRNCWLPAFSPCLTKLSKAFSCRIFKSQASVVDGQPFQPRSFIVYQCIFFDSNKVRLVPLIHHIRFDVLSTWILVYTDRTKAKFSVLLPNRLIPLIGESISFTGVSRIWSPFLRYA